MLARLLWPGLGLSLALAAPAVASAQAAAPGSCRIDADVGRSSFHQTITLDRAREYVSDSMDYARVIPSQYEMLLQVQAQARACLAGADQGAPATPAAAPQAPAASPSPGGGSGPVVPPGQPNYGLPPAPGQANYADPNIAQPLPVNDPGANGAGPGGCGGLADGTVCGSMSALFGYLDQLNNGGSSAFQSVPPSKR
jgi:hypothetical protein